MNHLKIKLGTFLVLLIFSMPTKAQNILPQVIFGKIERLESFQSKYVAPRNIEVWLPNGYSDTLKYAVLYMHDGQMLFDSAQSWNKQSWNVDDVALELSQKHKLKNFIVVGIWNNGQSRHEEYFPQKPFEQLSKLQKDTLRAQLKKARSSSVDFQPNSDKYLQFIVKELKPFIDHKYSVKSNKENTFIAGSSMGGLISVYAICEYPKVFGGAACLSTHWVGTFSLENNPIPDSFLNYLAKKLPTQKDHKIYFDCGDQTLDALYPNIQMKVDSVMKTKAYTSASWLTKYFPGEDHSEKSWNKRLAIPLEFLLKK